MPRIRAAQNLACVVTIPGFPPVMTSDQSSETTPPKNAEAMTGVPIQRLDKRINHADSIFGLDPVLQMVREKGALDPEKCLQCNAS